ncbi:altered inheritance of mitochondria protein 21 [Xylariaceae sp. FL0804]|nr:altered inheritance of mitochondria protein 21 [Xylariaceae sp. FL0804]
MSAATMQSTPVVPPRPSRSQDNSNSNNDKNNNGSSNSSLVPNIPPRPAKRFNRSVSPNPDRFAPSPLNESPFAPKSPRRFSQSRLGDSIERSKSVDMPDVGQEGQEYAAAIEELDDSPDVSRQTAGSPEQTRTVGEDVKLHAPKPTMPAASAKQRVAAVTRTDSDRAASFGIGRATSDELVKPTLKKKPSTASQLSHQSEDEGHGIPEIGQRVPMLANAGDVQAPSPAPPRAPSADATKSGGRNHHRKTSSRGGFGELPPGSYGLHGHGVESSGSLQKAYYEKHPELKQKEHYNHLHDRVHDYALSSADLNKIVRDTASRGAGTGSTRYLGTPSEQAGFQATEEYAARMSSSRPPSAAAHHESISSPVKASSADAADAAQAQDSDDGIIHVDDPNPHKGYAKYGDEEDPEDYADQESGFHTVLASDEVAKDPSPYELHPAVPPPRERRGSAYEMDESRSRPTSRPASIYSPPPPEIRSTPLADVEEYAPLFDDDEKSGEKPLSEAEKKERRQRFPSRDIWEDAPNSVYDTAEVNTPEPTGRRASSHASALDVPTKEGETPAQAFARRQEELAEKEAAVGPDSFLHRKQKPPSWVEHQAHLSKDVSTRPDMAHRFPSRDVWEDTPDSLQFTTTVSTPQTAEDTRDEDGTKQTEPVPNRPVVPARPQKQSSGDDAAAKPVVPNRPKPQVPTRPSKPSSDSKAPEAVPKQKPVVPARPVGGKIAALQAGFMSDLNNRLRLGPQIQKKEEPPAEEAPEEKEKAPLADARKGRARGPQRRAPTKSKSPAPPSASNGNPILSFSMTRTLFSIDEEGTMTVDHLGPETLPGIESKDAEASQQVESEQHPKDPEPKSEIEPQLDRQETSPSEPEPSDTQDTLEETKTLATNTAGESILEETIQKKEKSDEVTEVESVNDNPGA